jgi:hypothetical protein
VRADGALPAHRAVVGVEADGEELVISRVHHDTRHLTYVDDTRQLAARPGALQIVLRHLHPKADGT